MSMLLSGLPAHAGQINLAAEAAPIVASLLKQTPLAGKRVAVGGFQDFEKKLTMLSAMVSEDMEQALVSQASLHGFRMIDRRNFAELAKEWDLGMNGYVDDETLTKAGKLLGADVLCLGSYTRIGKKITLRVNLVGAEKGEILAATSTEIKLPSDLRGLDEKPLEAKPAAPAEAASPVKEALKVELTTDKAQYAIGDKMHLTVQVNQDCYLTLIDVGPTGKATVVFPNNYAPSNAVKAGVTYIIPDPSAGFEFEIGPPAGVEIIRAIASREPSVDLADAMSPLSSENPFGEVKKDLQVLTRDIRVKAKKARPGEWSESVLKLSIR
ncbi:MAG: hypothetical protein A2506_08115 [Elusimicrobia bacterium RIFOXYD12_FULL_66_9]|nr:MAG: hypothetical protein A2506_08115 [Elusimicrobia bacterium RIFOXYD12_FULL_66_9]